MFALVKQLYLSFPLHQLHIRKEKTYSCKWLCAVLSDDFR